jgi:hypothetical protein
VKLDEVLDQKEMQQVQQIIADLLRWQQQRQREQTMAHTGVQQAQQSPFNAQLQRIQNDKINALTKGYAKGVMMQKAIPTDLDKVKAMQRYSAQKDAPQRVR